MSQGLYPNLIKAEEKLELCHFHSLESFADLFVSVSLKNPLTSEIVKEVNVHHHTKKACRKYGTTCRFNFPKFPCHKTIVSVPSRIQYEDEEERKAKMKAHTALLKGVKEVLENEEKMAKICRYNQTELENILSNPEHTKDDLDEVLKQRVEKLLSIVDQTLFTNRFHGAHTTRQPRYAYIPGKMEVLYLAFI